MMSGFENLFGIGIAKTFKELRTMSGFEKIANLCKSIIGGDGIGIGIGKTFKELTTMSGFEKSLIAIANRCKSIIYSLTIVPDALIHIKGNSSEENFVLNFSH